MKTPSSRKYITVNVIRRANSAMIAGGDRVPSSLIASYNGVVMPSRETIVEAGRKAVQRHHLGGKKLAEA